jgi:uncharacterized protein (TIGR02246 family)
MTHHPRQYDARLTTLDNVTLSRGKNTMNRMLFAIGLMTCSLAVSIAAEPDQRANDEAAIRQAVAAYVDAFNKADAQALATLWSPEAVYSNPLSGVQVVGRAEIEKQFASIFSESKGVKLEATTHSIDFVSPNVAIEHGSAKLIDAEQLVEESDYSGVYVRRDGQWLLDRVTEEQTLEVPSHYEQLQELEWMVGKWVDQDEQATVTTECHWAKNNNFLVRSFTVQILDRVELSGMQIVGWDPASRQIRSWVFDSDGGFGQGTWTRNGNRWSIQQSGVLPDGRKSSSVNIFTYLDDDSFTLQSISRMVDGELLPNIDEVKITKEKE